MAWGRNNRGGGRGGNRGGSRGGNRRGGGGGGRRFEKVAQVALWENPNGGGDQPVLYGSVELENGDELRISLWESQSDNSKAPELTGTITREVGSGGNTSRDNEPENDEFDDDIPF